MGGEPTPEGRPALLARYLDRQGRVTGWPAKRAAQEAVLAYLAELLPGEQELSERQVGELLARHHTFGDPALLRRELVDRRFLERTADGRRYWRRRVPPDSP